MVPTAKPFSNLIRYNRNNLEENEEEEEEEEEGRQLIYSLLNEKLILKMMKMLLSLDVRIRLSS